MFTKFRTRLALAAFVVVAGAVGLTGAGGVPAGVFFGLPLVLCIPGYALVDLLMPRWSQATRIRRDGDYHLAQVVERMVLSVGLSLAVAALSALALNWTPWGVGRRQSTAFLSLLALAAIVAAHVRDRQQALTTLTELPGRLTLELYGLSWRRLAMMGLALLLVITALLLSARSATLASPGFTETWMVPQGSGLVQVGVRNRTLEPQRYRLRVTVDGRPVLSRDRLRLGPGQQWSAAVRTGSDTGQADLGVTGADRDTHLNRQLHVVLGGAAG